MQITFSPSFPGTNWPPGCDHEEPAAPESDFPYVYTCPAWMYDNPYIYSYEIPGTETMCETLEAEGITPTALFVDFESGVYLRNLAELEL